MMPQEPMGGGMPPQGPPAGAPPPQGGGQVDPQMVMEYFAQAVQALQSSGMTQEQAMTQAMQMVAQKFGPEAAQAIAMAASQGGQPGGGQAPMAGGPEQYGPATGAGAGMM